MYREEQRATDAINDTGGVTGKRVCDTERTVKGSCENGDVRNVGACATAGLRTGERARLGSRDKKSCGQEGHAESSNV